MAGQVVVEIPLVQVDAQDETFRCRLADDPAKLCPSLLRHGQIEPVILLGPKVPYRVVDGARRVRALAVLGVETVRAIVLDCDEERGRTIAWLANVQRAALKPAERALWVARALEQGWTVDRVAAELGISVRQVQRYRELAELPAPLPDLVADGVLSMAHAFVLKGWLKDRPGAEIRPWVERCKDGAWSADRLARELNRERHRALATGPRVLVESGRVRVEGFAIGTGCSLEELQRLMVRIRDEVEAGWREGRAKAGTEVPPTPEHARSLASTGGNAPPPGPGMGTDLDQPPIGGSRDTMSLLPPPVPRPRAGDESAEVGDDTMSQPSAPTAPRAAARWTPAAPPVLPSARGTRSVPPSSNGALGELPRAGPTEEGRGATPLGPPGSTTAG